MPIASIAARLRRLLGGIAAVGVLLSAAKTERLGAQLPNAALPPLYNGSLFSNLPAELCGTLSPAEEAALRFRPRSVLQDNIPLSFEQDPALLTGDYRGVVTLRNFLVIGDVTTVQFKPVGSDGIETWTRSGVTTISNRTLSVFTPSWSVDQVSRAYQNQEVGVDNPQLYWGEVLPTGTPPGGGFYVYLRVISNSVPAVTVRQLADDVQYSSAVVNIRLDDFGSSLLVNDENNYALDVVTKKFYQYFQDTYDSIGMTAGATRVAQAANAFHQRVRNDIRGIGLPLFDDSARYGSSGRLSGIEFFNGLSMTSNRSLPHETAHRWGAFIDWARLLGISLAGHQPGAHDPLMSGGETRLGAVLEGTRRVQTDGSTWTIQRTPFPIRFHPYMLYAMGLLAPENVPEVAVFETQGQFNATGVATPSVGTVVTGDTKTATAFNVIGMLGPREGPVATRWDQALVILSSGRLLSRREMDYWTFSAQRTADPNSSGVLSWNGFSSFDTATYRRIDLTHEIRPIAAEQIQEPLPVDFPRFAPTDFRDVITDSAIASLYDVGERFRFAGRVTATDHNDFNQILVGLYREPGDQANFIQGRSSVSANGSFDIALPVFTADQLGQWSIVVYLFWPGSGSQYARMQLGPLTVR